MLKGRDLSADMLGKGMQIALPGTTQAVAFTETATASAAVGSTTYAVRLVADKACHVEFATTPSATTAKMLLPAGVTEYFHIAGGQKVGVVRNAENGTLYVTEVK